MESTPLSWLPRAKRFWFSRILRSYWKTLVVALLAVLGETVADVLEPWPIKVIIDNVAGSQHLPGVVSRLLKFVPVASDKLHLGVLAAAASLLIAAIGAGAAYIDSYFSESVAQRVAHDLRMRTYHHLQRLSLSYYDKHQVSASLSTLSTDIQTIQDFASAGTLNILIDLLAVVGMLALMLSLSWDFALVAVAVAPFLLFEGIDHVDLAAITHPHLDHYGGYAAVRRALPVARRNGLGKKQRPRVEARPAWRLSASVPAPWSQTRTSPSAPVAPSKRPSAKAAYSIASMMSR